MMETNNVIANDYPGPLRCRVPTCNATYRRKEHLARHEATHTQPQALLCSHCGRTFGRSDTLRRHVRQRHKIFEPLSRARQACENCQLMKSRCEGGVPCTECLRRKVACSFKEQSRSTTGKGLPSPLIDEAASLRHPGVDQQLESGYQEKKQRYIRLYFEEFHPLWPFIHRGTFHMHRETPLLVQSMMVIGLWASKDKTAQSAAVDLHGTIRSAILEQKDKWDGSESDKASSTCKWPIPTYQAILLHLIFSIILNTHGTLGLDLKVTLPSNDMQLLEALVESCRRLGMLYYPNILAKYKHAGDPSFIWVSIEEIKRFNMALYKVCGKVSKLDTQKRGSLLDATELQFQMPHDNCPKWNAITREEWGPGFQDGDIDLDDTGEERWISRSAAFLHFLEV